MHNGTNTEMNIIRGLMLELWQKKRVDFENSSDLDSRLCASYPLIAKREEMENYLPGGKREKIEGEFKNYLWLKPSDKGDRLQPILHLKYDFSRSIPEINIRLGLFLKRDGLERAIGFRFESPHGIGEHHLYHLQLIRGFEKDDYFKPYHCPQWIPCIEPTIPILAKDSVSLLLCSIASLYGINEAVKLLRSMSGDWVSEYLKHPPYNPFDPLEWYRAVINEKSSEVREYHSFQGDPDEFEKKLKKKSRSHKIHRVTKNDYDKAPNRKKKNWGSKW